MHFSGVLCDLDGTLVNSLDFVERSWRTWAKQQGVDPEAVCQFLHGKPAISTLRHFMPNACDAELHDQFIQLEDFEAQNASGLTPVDGAVAFLSSLNQLGVPWGIVTSGSLKVASARIQHAGLPFPSILVTSEDIRLGKPDPQPFLLGAQRLNVPANRCIAFEDAIAGLQSANAAGCRVIEVLTRQSVAHRIRTENTLSHYLDLTVTQTGEADYFIRM